MMRLIVIPVVAQGELNLAETIVWHLLRAREEYGICHHVTTVPRVLMQTINHKYLVTEVDVIVEVE